MCFGNIYIKWRRQGEYKSPSQKEPIRCSADKSTTHMLACVTRMSSSKTNDVNINIRSSVEIKTNNPRC
jgi:hypothetical protein